MAQNQMCQRQLVGRDRLVQTNYSHVKFISWDIERSDKRSGLKPMVRDSDIPYGPSDRDMVNVGTQFLNEEWPEEFSPEF